MTDIKTAAQKQTSQMKVLGLQELGQVSGGLAAWSTESNNCATVGADEWSTRSNGCRTVKIER
jgi:hypothetical protein